MLKSTDTRVIVKVYGVLLPMLDHLATDWYFGFFVTILKAGFDVVFVYRRSVVCRRSIGSTLTRNTPLVFIFCVQGICWSHRKARARAKAGG